ncbi:Phosphatidylinositol N-acetylglucosaminyltransferase [Bertholletia excelsa]
MALKHHLYRSSSPFPKPFSAKCSTTITIILFLASFIYFFALLRTYPEEFSRSEQRRFSGDLRNVQFPWNKLCFGLSPGPEKLKLAVFSKSWPIGASPGGMERHASTLYRALAGRGHEIHVFTAPSDRVPLQDFADGGLHVHFAANNRGSINFSLAFEKFLAEGNFDYIHTESVSLPHWRAKRLPNLAVTWHGIWYEIMHSKLFQELLWNTDGNSMTKLQESMPKLIEEIRFFPSYAQHITISSSAGEILTNIYQIPRRNVHVILNGVDDGKFSPDPDAGERFRRKHGVPANATLVLGVAGRLVRDKGHPLLHEAFSTIAKKYPTVFLLVAGSGPWGRRYSELGPNVRVLGPLEPEELSEFYNALHVFVNPTLRPQGLDLTLIEAMHCGKTVLTPNFPSITGTVVVNEELGFTFSPNLRSFVEALEGAIGDGPEVLQMKGRLCKEYVGSMFTAAKMASAYERFFLCMKDSSYCKYPLPTDC